MDRTRAELVIHGVVQGVGFRPFVYRVAAEHGLSGWVTNEAGCVRAELEGEPESLRRCIGEIESNPPPSAVVRNVTVRHLPPAGYAGFEIRPSAPEPAGRPGPVVPPDLAMCDHCRKELSDPADRRFRHPFITCTQCGPRYTIVRNVPYDRSETTMAHFAMCPHCRDEYHDPIDRRHHAQPICCPNCGPKLRFLDRDGVPVEGDPVREARRWLRKGMIVAVQGLGGFHLACLATRSRTVRRLRRRKGRESRPLAVMVSDAAAAARVCHVDPAAERALRGPEAPIVLLPSNDRGGLAPNVNGGSGYTGIMVAYSPLHALLTERMPPLVMTSANRSGEPMVTSPRNALRRLEGVADGFLVHDRPIERRCDDSVVAMLGGTARVVRRGRGFVPREIRIPAHCAPLLAFGAEQKGHFCLAHGNWAYLSPYIGDLREQATVDEFEREIGRFGRLVGIEPTRAACDRHPDYMSSVLARQSGLPVVAVQHHHAHIASVLAERMHYGQVLGVAFDGAGYGDDGAIWGGEFLLASARGYERLAHLRYVPQPGGDRAAMEPWRMAAACLETYCPDEAKSWPRRLRRAMDRGNWPLLWQAVRGGVSAPMTSSMGRLFDAVSAILGLCYRAGYEGEAAVILEGLARPDYRGYDFDIVAEDGGWIIDPGRMLREILQDLRQGISIPDVAGRFHLGLAEMIARMCRIAREQTGVGEVALSGGVFDNRKLAVMTLRALEKHGFTVLFNRAAPANDGGIALGQALVAAMKGCDREEW